MKKVIIIAIFILIAPFAFANKDIPSAPFGLEWGVSKQSVIKQGISFKNCKTLRNLTTCNSSDIIKPLSIAESYTLVFAKNHGLVKAIAYGKTIENDATGSEGKETYNKFKKILGQKYGSPTSEFELTGVKLFKDSDEFYQCLKYDGCGAYVSIFNKSGVTSAIELKGLSRGKGYLKLAFEGPEFSSSIDAYNEIKNKSDSDAL